MSSGPVQEGVHLCRERTNGLVRESVGQRVSVGRLVGQLGSSSSSDEAVRVEVPVALPGKRPPTS